MRLTYAAGAMIAGLVALTGPGHAQPVPAIDATWVSATVGDDDEDCSFARPCRTFANAIAKTNPNGVMTTLEPGDYGPFVINKSITVVGVPGAVINVDSGTGITISGAAEDQVTVIGLTLNGQGQGKGAFGIDVSGTAPGKLTITDCVITNFNAQGFRISSAANSTRVLLRNSLIVNNALGGAAFFPPRGSTYGVVVKGTTFDLNGDYALTAASPAAQVIISQSRMLRSPNGLKNVAGASFTSYGDNIIRNGSGPTSTIPQN